MAKKNIEDNISIQDQRIDEQRVALRIVGITPLIVHSWSEKAKKEIRDKQMGKKSVKGKEPKDPFDDFIQSAYWLEGKPVKSTPEAFEEAVKNGAKWGFKVTAIKQSANVTAYRKEWVKNQTQLKAAYFITGWDADFFEIKGSTPIMREDNVKIGMGTADLRYRAMFEEWYADIVVSYDANSGVTLEQIINYINAAGYSNGIGEWRPEKDGNFGRFRVVTDIEHTDIYMHEDKIMRMLASNDVSYEELVDMIAKRKQ